MATFSTLPSELHLLIFHHAILSQCSTPDGRIHTIHPSPSDPKVQISDQPVPSLLHTCSTTRSLFFALFPDLTFAYGTYINFSLDTIFLAHCPGPMVLDKSGCGYVDGFEVCKALGRGPWRGKVRKLAVNDSFWLRSSQLARSVAVDTWNMVVKSKDGFVGLEELVVVFGGGVEQEGGWETVGWYRNGEVGEKQRRCDDFLRVYLGYFPRENRVPAMRIRYVISK